MFASLKLPLATAEAKRRQNVSTTFTEPLHVQVSREAELKAFLADFYKTIYQKRNELHILLEEHPSLSAQYQTLVMQENRVTYEDFWQRYFWRCDAHRVLKEWAAKDQERAAARPQYISGGLARVQKFLEESTVSSTHTSTSDKDKQSNDYKLSAASAEESVKEDINVQQDDNSLVKQDEVVEFQKKPEVEPNKKNVISLGSSETSKTEEKGTSTDQTKPTAPGTSSEDKTSVESTLKSAKEEPPADKPIPAVPSSGKHLSPSPSPETSTALQASNKAHETKPSSNPTASASSSEKRNQNMEQPSTSKEKSLGDKNSSAVPSLQPSNENASPAPLSENEKSEKENDNTKKTEGLPKASSSHNKENASNEQIPLARQEKPIFAETSTTPTKGSKIEQKESSKGPSNDRKSNSNEPASNGREKPIITNQPLATPTPQSPRDNASFPISSITSATPKRSSKVDRIKSYFERANTDARKSNRSMESPPKRSGEKPLFVAKRPREAPVLRLWRHDSSNQSQQKQNAPPSPRSVLSDAPDDQKGKVIKNVIDTSKNKTGVSKTSSQERMWIAALSIATLAIAAALMMFSSPVLDGICAPAFPGYELSATNDDDLYLEAPWWAPWPYKARAFSVICGNNRTRTAVEWIPFDKKRMNRRLTLHALDSDRSEVIRRDKRRLSSARFSMQHIVTVDQHGSTDDIPAPWTLSRE